MLFIRQVYCVTIFVFQPCNALCNVGPTELVTFVLWSDAVGEEIQTVVVRLVDLLEICCIDPATVGDPEGVQPAV